jgi:hypothetical protein
LKKYLRQIIFKYLPIILIGFGFTPKILAQSNHYVIIDTILISGNDHTKSFVIENELVFKKDSIYEWASLDEMAVNSHKTLTNTNLFVSTKVSWVETKYQHITVSVDLVEKWYIWPIPAFELADRNYKQWSEKGYKANRTNYGLYLFTYNFRGRNETIKLSLINGYTRNYGIQYIAPYLDKKGRYGLDVSTSFKQNKEIWYATQNQKLMFYKNFENTLIQRFENKFAFTTRRDNFINERWEIEYNRIKIGDTVSTTALNPTFLLSNKKQSESYIKHILNYEKRDNKYYPLTGFYFKNEISIFAIRADTASLEMIRVISELGLYREIHKKTYLSFFFKTKLSNQPIPFIPYYNFKSLGYKDYVRGYEQYVVDGHAFMLAKLNLKWAAMHQHFFKTPFYIHKKRIKIPAGIYLNLFTDWGKVYNNQTSSLPGGLSLNKKDLVGFGSGIDFLVYNDKIVRFEYSLNILGDKNFNLHFEKAF